MGVVVGWGGEGEKVGEEGRVWRVCGEEVELDDVVMVGGGGWVGGVVVR